MACILGFKLSAAWKIMLLHRLEPISFVQEADHARPLGRPAPRKARRTHARRHTVAAQELHFSAAVLDRPSTAPKGKAQGIANNVTELIGNTPMVFLNKVGLIYIYLYLTGAACLQAHRRTLGLECAVYI